MITIKSTMLVIQKVKVAKEIKKQGNRGQAHVHVQRKTIPLHSWIKEDWKHVGVLVNFCPWR